MYKRDLLVENVALRAEVKALKEKIEQLEQKVAVFENHPTIADGIRGETLIADLIAGAVVKGNASYDIQTGPKALKLEIKFARLNDAVKKLTNKTYRWAWAKPFGESGKKVYDRLILIGGKDSRFYGSYLDTNSPYIFFDVPFAEIAPLTIKTSRWPAILLTTNPRTAKSTASPLFRLYRVTITELSKRYGF